MVALSWVAKLQMPHSQHSSVALDDLLCGCHWPAQWGTGSHVSSKWRHRLVSSHKRTGRQSERWKEGQTERKGRPISALGGFVVCLSCSDRRGVDLQSVEGTIKDDISLKGGLYGVTERLLSSATGCVFSLTCPSPCMSSLL